MLDHAAVGGLLMAALFHAAWRDHASGNRHDATLLAGLGLGGTLAGALAWLAWA